MSQKRKSFLSVGRGFPHMNRKVPRRQMPSEGSGSRFLGHHFKSIRDSLLLFSKVLYLPNEWAARKIIDAEYAIRYI